MAQDPSAAGEEVDTEGLLLLLLRSQMQPSCGSRSMNIRWVEWRKWWSLWLTFRVGAQADVGEQRNEHRWWLTEACKYQWQLDMCPGQGFFSSGQLPLDSKTGFGCSVEKALGFFCLPGAGRKGCSVFIVWYERGAPCSERRGDPRRRSSLLIRGDTLTPSMQWGARQDVRRLNGYDRFPFSKSGLST
jgi:hypothetical protein